MRLCIFYLTTAELLLDLQSAKSLSLEVNPQFLIDVAFMVHLHELHTPIMTKVYKKIKNKNK